MSTEAIQNAKKLSEAEITVHKHQVALVDAQKLSTKQLQEACSKIALLESTIQSSEQQNSEVSTEATQLQ